MRQLKTRCRKVNAQNPEPACIKEAAEIILGGGLAAFPTETVYGLGANALDGQAVRSIFKAKGRPADNPLTLHVAGFETALPYLKDVPKEACALAKAFLPGPLTMILPYRGGLPAEVTGGKDSLGVRLPDHPVALALIREAGVPLVAPSANLSGRPSPTTAGHVLEDLAGRIDVVLDGGPTGLGLESTVVDLTGDKPVMLRPGLLTPEDLVPVLGRIEQGQAPAGKYTHYTPRAGVVLVEGSDPERVANKMRELARKYSEQGKKTGLLIYREEAGAFTGFTAEVAGSRSEPATVAAGLFGALRRLDKLGVDIIICAGFPGKGLGLAVQNRLRLAAGGNIIQI
ncbi:L-threonylcarbamoyladenylate synthase [Desulfolucanica intricata]|uniref:L-threonylcarbamoyladenylate synthase n=1 Tax=Desulfolucanica intricata TaxID=1285191 RepID=UPI00082E0E24|nr:L-threonylcarbamoyladenylate synthase [Desulfolucanica intricata]